MLPEQTPCLRPAQLPYRPLRHFPVALPANTVANATQIPDKLPYLNVLANANMVLLRLSWSRTRSLLPVTIVRPDPLSRAPRTLHSSRQCRKANGLAAFPRIAQISTTGTNSRVCSAALLGNGCADRFLESTKHNTSGAWRDSVAKDSSVQHNGHTFTG